MRKLLVAFLILSLTLGFSAAQETEFEIDDTAVESGEFVELEHHPEVEVGEEFRIVVETSDSAGTIVELGAENLETTLEAEDAVNIEGNRVEFLDATSGDSLYGIVGVIESTDSGEVEIRSWINAEDPGDADDIVDSQIQVEESDEEDDHEDEETLPEDYDFSVTSEETTEELGGEEHTFELVEVDEEDSTVRINDNDIYLEVGDTAAIRTAEVRLVGLEEDSAYFIVTEEQEIEEPEPEPPVEEPLDVELNIDDEVEPGETVEAQITAEETDDEELTVYWRVSAGVTSDNVGESNEPRIEFETSETVRDEEFQIHAQVRDQDGNSVSVEELVEWDLPDIDAEGLEVDYGDDSIIVQVSEEELANRPEFRAGTALEGFTEIDLWGRNVVGGAEIQLDQFESDMDDSLDTYSAVEVSGENLDGVTFSPDALVDEEWLHENELIVSSSEAFVSFYQRQNGEWEKVSSMVSRSSVDNALEISPDFRGDENPFELSGETAFAIAGDSSGIDLGNHAINPQGECERLEEDEPVPPGWEEIDVTCNTHEETTRTESELDQLTNRIEDTERFAEEIQQAEDYLEDNRPALADREIEKIERMISADDMREQVDHLENEVESVPGVDGFSERFESMRSRIDDYEEGDTEIDMRELDRDMRDLSDDVQEELRELEREAGSAHPTEMAVQIERVLERPENEIQNLPEEIEELEEFYEEPEDLQEQVQDVEDLMENEEFEEAEQQLRELERDIEQALEPVRQGRSAYETIQDLRNHEDVEEEHIEDLDEAEQLLVEDQEVEEASELVEGVRRSVEVQQMREVVMEMLQDDEVRQLVRDVVAEVIPGLG